MGGPSTGQPMVLASNRTMEADGLAFSKWTHHPCLGLPCLLPYSADRGRQSVNRKALDELKQQIPLLDYRQAHDWRPARCIRDERQMGLCPLIAVQISGL